MLSLPFTRRRDDALHEAAVDVAPASHILTPLREQIGAEWKPHARRALADLPRELGWAAPLLDPEQPTTVLCDSARVGALMRWHNHLPTYEQVLFDSRKRRPAPAVAPPAA